MRTAQPDRPTRCAPPAPPAARPGRPASSTAAAAAPATATTPVIVTLCAGACPPVTLALGGLPADLATVDRLLRLLLEARRSRIAVRLEAAADDAWELLDLLGVSHLLRGPPGECRPEGQDPSRGGSPYSPNRSG